jgi:hypothetical protein
MNPLKRLPLETTMAILPRKMDEMMINRLTNGMGVPSFHTNPITVWGVPIFSTLPKMKLDNAARSRE